MVLTDDDVLTGHIEREKNEDEKGHKHHRINTD